MSFLRKLFFKRKDKSTTSSSLAAPSQDAASVTQPSEEGEPPSYSASMAPSQLASTQLSGSSSRDRGYPRTQYRAKDFGAASNKFGAGGFGG
ncbi:hypothetical protein OPQ81_008690 [Rhizoctonia solani]|nr:hypothetical protein OPQ81_008690 [Rhizoctonia solani]